MDAGVTSAWVGLRLEPLDTLFFRDGRPFDAATRVIAGLPNPQVLTGALRTALLAQAGFDFARFAKVRKHRPLLDALNDCHAPGWITAARWRGPWLGLKLGNAVEPLLPLPATLRKAKNVVNGWSRAMPLPQSFKLPGWRSKDHALPDGLLPLWRRTEPDPKAEGGWLKLAALKRFLEDKGNPLPSEVFAKEELYEEDNRIGIGIDMHTLTSAEGELYGIRLLSLRPEVCFYAEMQPGPNAPARPWFRNTPVPFGGEGKYVRVEEVPPRDWPKANSKRTRSLWYLATPTFLSRGEARHPLPEGVKAAASGSSIAISGWDVARNGPRPTRFAVPAGAVYFREGAGAENGFINDDQDRKADELLAEGWGFALQGAWKEERP